MQLRDPGTSWPRLQSQYDNVTEPRACLRCATKAGVFCAATPADRSRFFVLRARASASSPRLRFAHKTSSIRLQYSLSTRIIYQGRLNLRRYGSLRDCIQICKLLHQRSYIHRSACFAAMYREPLADASPGPSATARPGDSSNGATTTASVITFGTVGISGSGTHDATTSPRYCDSEYTQLVPLACEIDLTLCRSSDRQHWGSGRLAPQLLPSSVFACAQQL